MRKYKFKIDTHGCKLNQADSEVLSREFQEAGFLLATEEQLVDVYVLNSCTVTHIADRKARKALRSAHKVYPKALIVVTGCYPERDKRELEALNEVDLIIGNVGKKEIVSQVKEHPKMFERKEEIIDENISFNISRNRSMVKIQEGCNQICAYCIVPKVRGRESSVSPVSIINQINNKAENGIKEVVLTGTQLGSYGFDLENYNLKKLLRTILRNTNIERIRMSSLQPQEIDQELLDIWDDKRMCNHFHVPLQSGSDDILKRMRRRYTSGEYLKKTKLIKSYMPNASITTDVIVGFPGEHDEDFEASMNICKASFLSDIHVFPYSKRSSTSANYFKDQVSSEIKKVRVNKILSLKRTLHEKFLDLQIGSEHFVLWEKSSELGDQFGLTSNYLKAVTKVKKEITNQISNCLVKERLGTSLLVDVI